LLVNLLLLLETKNTLRGRIYDTYRYNQIRKDTISYENDTWIIDMSSNIRVPKICQLCGAEFIAKTTVTKFCGDNCAKRAYKKRKREQKVKEVAPAVIQKVEFNQQ